MNNSAPLKKGFSRHQKASGERFAAAAAESASQTTKIYEQQVKDLESNRKLREKYSGRVFWFLCIYCLSIFYIILSHGAKRFLLTSTNFELPEWTLTTLAGSTVASAIGLMMVVVKGLFDNNK